MSTPDTPHDPTGGAAPRPPDHGSAPPSDVPPPPATDDDPTPPSDTPPPPATDDDPTPPSDGPTPPPHDGSTPPPGDPPPPGGGAFQLSMGGRRLYRRSDDRVIAGVASGLGDFFGLDSAIFRVVFVALSIFGGSGFLLYLLGWLFLPTRGSESIGEGLLRRVGGPRSAGGIALLVVATIVVLDSFEIFGGGPLLAAVLIGVGVLLYRSSDDDGNPSGERSDAFAGTGAGSVDTTRSTRPPASGGTAHGAATFDPSASTTSTIPPEVYDELPPPPPGLYDDWRPTPQPPPAEPPPAPSILGRLTVAAALIVLGGLALIENLTPLEVSVASYAALTLTVLGAGLIVGARYGRARGLIALGVIVLIALLTTSALPAIPGNGAGQRFHTPQLASDIQEPYELTFGEMIIDLTELELEPNGRATVDARLGVGSLQVVVPDGVSVEGDASTTLGAVDALDRTAEGNDADVSFRQLGPEGSPTIALDLHTGVGEIDIYRETPEDAR